MPTVLPVSSNIHAACPVMGKIVHVPGLRVRCANVSTRQDLPTRTTPAVPPADVMYAETKVLSALLSTIRGGKPSAGGGQTIITCAPPALTEYQNGVSEPADLYGVGYRYLHKCITCQHNMNLVEYAQPYTRFEHYSSPQELQGSRE